MPLEQGIRFIGSNTSTMKNNGRPYFPFMRSYYEAIEQCQEGVQLELYRAISLYGLNRIEPQNMSALSNTLWTLIKPLLDKQWTKFDNGKKGGTSSEAMKGNQNARKQTENKPKTNLIQIENEATLSMIKDKGKRIIDKETTNVAKKGELSLNLSTNERFAKFNSFLQVECPSVAKMKSQMTEREFHKLMERFNDNSSLLAECFRKLDNSPKGVKNKSVYRTMTEWDREGYFDAIRKEKGHDI